MSKRVEAEAKQAEDDLRVKTKDLKIIMQEINSYTRQLQDLDKAQGGQVQSLQNANNALKSTIH